MSFADHSVIVVTPVYEDVEASSRLFLELAAQKQQGLELDYYFREPNYIHTFGHEQFAPLVSNAGREVVQRDSRGFFLYCSTWLR